MAEPFSTAGVGPEARAEATDRELVAECQAGHAAAFDALVRRHQNRAFNVAVQLLRNAEDAAEVAQDAFVRIHRNLGTFRGECEFTTWLHQIVVNLARNKHRWWRRRGRQRTVSLDAPREAVDGMAGPELAAPTPGPDLVAEQSELARRVAAGMARLPAPWREVLVLRNVEQLSYEEMAVVLKCSLGTVKSRIARAREALRELVPNE
jgi:RNA polymerase sigma-70 factor (ECF subfamily)